MKKFLLLIFIFFNCLTCFAEKSELSKQATAFYSDNKNYYLDNERINYGSAIIVGNDTLVNGEELTATLLSTMVIDNDFSPLLRVFVTEATITTELHELSTAEIQIFPNPSEGIVEIITEQPIINISVCDYIGRVLLNRTCNSQRTSLDILDFKGLAIVYVVLENGQTFSQKLLVQ